MAGGGYGQVAAALVLSSLLEGQERIDWGSRILNKNDSKVIFSTDPDVSYSDWFSTDIHLFEA
ncbi:hypothetical protein [Microbulbifer thermotolerans]|uniref:hypothetical protein n=1 Tax=Microbulbifer thermotolerans TaxID=252514 RepID=UPI0022499B1D|nr:hypothetical protein [Microbulbifer thermotolerans]MCX2830746.1 hypothetical protein [Microbulbifer thermotolerans]